MHDYRSLKAVADQFQVSSETIRRWARTGQFPQPFKLGRKVLFRVADIVQFEAARVA